MIIPNPVQLTHILRRLPPLRRYVPPHSVLFNDKGPGPSTQATHATNNESITQANFYEHFQKLNKADADSILLEKHKDIQKVFPGISIEKLTPDVINELSFLASIDPGIPMQSSNKIFLRETVATLLENNKTIFDEAAFNSFMKYLRDRQIM